MDELPPELFLGRTILVLSDAFPPYVSGGAEISLFACTSALPIEQRKKMVVLTFAGDCDQMEYALQESILVIRAPRSAAWPFNHQPWSAVGALPHRKLLGERLHTRLMLARRMTTGESRTDSILAYREARARPKGGVLTDHLMSNEEWQTSTAVNLVAMFSRLDLLVADNTRSILIGAEINRQFPNVRKSTAIVRDNRFHCPRPSQSRAIKGKLCQDCAFQCASIDAAHAEELRKATLAKTEQVRRRALSSFTDVIVTSHELMRFVAPKLDNSSRIHRVPNSFGEARNIKKYCESSAQLPSDTLVMIGMLNENKGQLEFLKNCHQWISRNPGVNINICGRGNRMEKAISKFIKDRKIDKQVRLLGFRSREQIFQEIRKAKLVVAPTVWAEPFGRVPLEAGIAGRSIVAFAVGGLNESIVSGKTGFLVAPGDYSQLTQRIDLLLNNPDLRIEMEHCARSHIENSYSREKTIDEFNRVAFDHIAE